MSLQTPVSERPFTVCSEPPGQGSSLEQLAPGPHASPFWLLRAPGAQDVCGVSRQGLRRGWGSARTPPHGHHPSPHTGPLGAQCEACAQAVSPWDFPSAVTSALLLQDAAANPRSPSPRSGAPSRVTHSRGAASRAHGQTFPSHSPFLLLSSLQHEHLRLPAITGGLSGTPEIWKERKRLFGNGIFYLLVGALRRADNGLPSPSLSPTP